MSLLAAFVFILGGYAFAYDESTNCSGDMPVPAKHAQLESGDQHTLNHLQFSRKITLDAPIDLNICNADLTMVAVQGDVMHVTVDASNTSSQPEIAEYLAALDVTRQKTHMRLNLPRSFKAKITVEIPLASVHLVTNLGRGDLYLRGERMSGERTINVGAGHMYLEADEDFYESLHVNIGVGSMHDHRRGGKNHHFIVAQSMTGTGKGELVINVGAGGVDLNPVNGRAQ